ncbi:hypothetical protein OGATHE_001069 [Ogataea polymorpha]|uniref:Uncharacterized protein n=1 Tax=Ogataea polymorpha TaxID=460523 RepID=A0A9P8TFD8_9ASCO|nr:hypothetical protein OGATHE_001069 [Ogataea polymorpha]
MLDHMPGVPGIEGAPGDMIPGRGGSMLDVVVRRVPPGVSTGGEVEVWSLGSLRLACLGFANEPCSVGPANDCSKGFGSKSSVFLPDVDPDPFDVGDPTEDALASVCSDVIMT